MGSWSLVVTTFISPFIGETLTFADILASAITIGGIVLTVLGAYTDAPELSTKELIRRYRDPGVVAMLSVLACCVAVCATLIAVDYYARVAAARKKQAAVAPPNRHTIGHLYIVLGALVATFTVLLGKANSEMLLPTIEGDNQFTSPAAYVVVLCFLVSLPSQVRGCAGVCVLVFVCAEHAAKADGVCVLISGCVVPAVSDQCKPFSQRFTCSCADVLCLLDMWQHCDRCCLL